MRPDDQQDRRVGTPIPARPHLASPPPREPQNRTNDPQQEAAANIMRSKIDSLYEQPAQANAPDAQPTPATDSLNQSIEYDNPYDRTHAQNPQPQSDEWQKYHTAWRTYYQKYYQGYYAHHAKKLADELTTQATQPAPEAEPAQDSSEDTADSFGSKGKATRSGSPGTRDQAVEQLRSKLRSHVRTVASKARASNHFVPIASALLVVVVFVFLQFNQVIFGTVKAYISPGEIDPQNLVVDPSASLAVGPESRLIIPKINVDAPVFYNIKTDKASQLKAMENGIAHFPIPGANSRPGEVGNTVLSAHSSNDVFARGDYKFIFAQLERLEIGDTIYAHFRSIRYTYTVTKKEVVKPSQVNKLVYSVKKPVLTLITCTPLGTAEKRLLVTAEQVNPDPSKAAAAPKDNNSEKATTLPSEGEPTLLERIFGA